MPSHICSQCSLDSSLRIMICLLKIPSTNATRVCILKMIQKSFPGWLFNYLLTERQEEENSNTEDMTSASGPPPFSVILGQSLTSCNATICNPSGLGQAYRSIQIILQMA